MVFWFFIFLSLVGNCWVIFVITSRRQLRTTANWFILSLAAADLGVTCVYFSTYVICEVILDTCNEKVAGIFTFFFAKVSAIGLIARVAELQSLHSLYCNRAFAEIRTCFHDRQKNIYYYWGLLGISISIPRFETRHVSCRRQTFVC